MKRIFILILLLSGFAVPMSSLAQDEAQKIYSYDSINTTIVVNPDSTFTVEEDQLFNYQSGVFHQGLRYVPLNKISRITGVTVTDGATGQPLRYSMKRLDKMNPSSWGSYTTYIQGENLYIEWYYELSNTKHLWELQYTVHGGLEFYKNNDRLYWNIFSGYDAPVNRAKAEVEFPEGVDVSQFKFDAYRTVAKLIEKNIHPNHQLDFETFFVAPGEAFTVDIAFPKGIVQESAFWRDWVQANYGYLGSVAAAFAGIVFLIAYWYRTERYKKGRGIIIAQYEPPQHLRPAMAEVLLTEAITDKAWPATIVDLAVRGYVRVVEEDPGISAVIGQIIAAMIMLAVVGLIGFSMILIPVPPFALLLFVLLAIFAISRAFAGREKSKKWFTPTSYRVERIKEYQADLDLQEYEKKFLSILFPGGKSQFSLKEMKKDQTAQRALSKALLALRQTLYEETDLDTKAFANGTSKSKYFGYVVSGLIMFWFGTLQMGIISINDQLQFLILSLITVSIFIFGFIRFEPRLSKEGYLLKEDWLGFKLYLETAEQYRLQNLTPDIFEKYLPYAMIFGIEKKWARTFETMSMQPPTWYGSSMAGVAVGSSAGSGFSPVTFSSSFSSSFTSAFASSGGSSSGGGGGSAGGGGGGGGGGAS